MVDVKWNVSTQLDLFIAEVFAVTLFIVSQHKAIGIL